MKKHQDAFFGYIAFAGLLILQVWGAERSNVERCRYNAETARYEVFQNKRWQLIGASGTSRDALAAKPKKRENVSETYIAAVAVSKFQRLPNGVYCVKCANSHFAQSAWTVWSAELFDAVKKRQQWH